MCTLPNPLNPSLRHSPPGAYFFSASSLSALSPTDEESRGILRTFLTNVVRDAVVYCEHAMRKTVTAMDVV